LGSLVYQGQQNASKAALSKHAAVGAQGRPHLLYSSALFCPAKSRLSIPSAS
jgi:hypothetical protein